MPTYAGFQVPDYQAIQNAWKGGGVNQDAVNYIKGLGNQQLQYGALMALGGNNSNPTFTAAANALMPGAYSSAGGTSADFAHFLDQGSRGMLDPNMDRNGQQWQDTLAKINGMAGSVGYTGNDYSGLTQPGQQQTMNADPSAGGQSQSMPGPNNMTAGSYPDAPGMSLSALAGKGSAPAPAAGGGTSAPGAPSSPGGTPFVPNLPGSPNTPTVSDPSTSGLPYSSEMGQLDPMRFLNPGMQFAMDQSNQQIQNSAAARGGLLSGNTLREIAQNSSGIASQAYQQAFQNAIANQGQQFNFSLGSQQTQQARDQLRAQIAQWGANNGLTQEQITLAQENADRNFDYQAQTGDRNFNYQAALTDSNTNWSRAMQLAQLGMGGTQGTANAQQWLASILANNAINAGQANAGGTVGGTNAVTSAISNYLSSILGNNWLQALMPQLQGQPTG